MPAQAGSLSGLQDVLSPYIVPIQISAQLNVAKFPNCADRWAGPLCMRRIYIRATPRYASAKMSYFPAQNY